MWSWNSAEEISVALLQLRLDPPPSQRSRPETSTGPRGGWWWDGGRGADEGSPCCCSKRSVGSGWGTGLAGLVKGITDKVSTCILNAQILKKKKKKLCLRNCHTDQPQKVMSNFFLNVQPYFQIYFPTPTFVFLLYYRQLLCWGITTRYSKGHFIVESLHSVITV
jgi:hypothetical protein